jgi:hypothetical protein
MIKLRRRLRRELDDDRGSLPMLMLVVIVGLALGGLMVPMIVNQNVSTRTVDSRVQSLQAAQAGLDATLGQLRVATTDGGTTGDASQLPCFTSANPLSGTVLGSANMAYSVQVQYFTSDPFKVVVNTGSLPTPMLCSSGYGAFDPATGLVVPSYALITSVGTNTIGANSSSVRTLQSTYIFNTTNANTDGGQIRLNPPTTTSGGTTPPNYCMDGGLTPAVNTQVKLQVCSATATGQIFFYNQDLSVQLLSSVTTANTDGLCLDAPIPHANGGLITLQQCAAAGSATSRQQWSLNGSAEFLATKSDLTRDSTLCIGAATQSAGASVQVLSCPGSYDTTASWLPSPSVGAGAAGASNGQLVNFSQFGRCADVTNQTAPTSSDNPFMILYPCKQDPNPANVDWNQKFAYNFSTYQWATIYNSKSYCLTSAGTAGGYTTVILCDTSKASQQWLEYGTTTATGPNAAQYSYDVRYTIKEKSGQGLCLSLSPTTGDNPDYFVPSGTSLQYSKLTTDRCDGTTRQKWNADPNTISSALQNTIEK